MMSERYFTSGFTGLKQITEAMILQLLYCKYYSFNPITKHKPLVVIKIAEINYSLLPFTKNTYVYPNNAQICKTQNLKLKPNS